MSMLSYYFVTFVRTFFPDRLQDRFGRVYIPPPLWADVFLIPAVATPIHCSQPLEIYFLWTNALMSLFHALNVSLLYCLCFVLNQRNSDVYGRKAELHTYTYKGRVTYIHIQRPSYIHTHTKAELHTALICIPSDKMKLRSTCWKTALWPVWEQKIST